MILISYRILVKKVILSIVVLAMAFSPLSVFADNHDAIELEDLLPKYNNYSWIYNGSVEYGHDMEIISIVVNNMSKDYFILGEVHDMSDGESDMDHSLGLEYSIQSDVVIQRKSEEMMLDSDFDEIELIRTPLEEGNTWNQDVENPEGQSTTFQSTITNVEESDEVVIFTVRYKDVDSCICQSKSVPYFNRKLVHLSVV